MPRSGRPAIATPGWKVIYVDSVQSDAPVTQALDGNINTIWHTQYSPLRPAHPHTVTLDLGALVMPGGLRYVPRQSGSNGNNGQYQLALSQDGQNWTLATAGVFADSALTKTVSFVAPGTSLCLR